MFPMVVFDFSILQASQKIQDWLTNCARDMSAKVGLNMQWETPLGLTVRQPYIRKTSNRLNEVTTDCDKPETNQRDFLCQWFQQPKLVSVQS